MQSEIGSVSNRKVGVFGLGKTGVQSVKTLLAKGFIVNAWDDSEGKVLEVKKIIKDNNVMFSNVLNEDEIADLEFVIVSPGIPFKYPAPHRIFTYCQKYNIPIKTDIELLFEASPNANFIGVTGTNGKSTTVSLINHVLEVSNRRSVLGGNIGTPALSLPILQDPSENYVLELSSYQLEILNNFQFNIAALLSITPDHLDRYESVDSYTEAKLRIFQNQMPDDFAIISINTENGRNIHYKLNEVCAQKIIPISSEKILDSGVSIIEDKLYDCYFEHETLHIFLPQSLRGQHNAENITVAYVAAKILGITTQEIIQALSTFVGLPHRMELVFQRGQMTFINDSKATNIASASKALDLYQDIYWIAGGIFKEKDVFSLGSHLRNVKRCYLVGMDAEIFIPLLAKHSVPYMRAGSIENALLEIKKETPKGTVLLSPACASFDQWKNFEERGDVFRALVLKHFAS
ncbi:UDP-N-acetylmuramoyl-L-alanine--D-glutamate ligase [Candidatus Bandiella euplotis]|uniref:UDP-N-acetylmuramoyl-L-alanine--D-glutamate ligase n=1 Tax=Candidatus Bandiella euplotis TaxID=1664265 RepID=UPI002B25FAA6|nr:UDP-N-acetylmuramoyl-L-alanine--D-glutamate ligase [Candidatus Bandiella woodruffii]